MDIIKSNVNELKKLKPTKVPLPLNQFLEQVFSLVIIVGSALALWKTLVLGFNSECPVVVVLTGSMEPGYYRGDILFVYFFFHAALTGTNPSSLAIQSSTTYALKRSPSSTEYSQSRKGKTNLTLR